MKRIDKELYKASIFIISKNKQTNNNEYIEDMAYRMENNLPILSSSEWISTSAKSPCLRLHHYPSSQSGMIF